MLNRDEAYDWILDNADRTPGWIVRIMEPIVAVLIFVFLAPFAVIGWLFGRKD